MITPMVQVAVYDASVLYPSTTRDLLIRVAQAGLVQARWTETILDEVFRSIRADRPDLDPAKLLRTRALMGTLQMITKKPTMALMRALVITRLREMMMPHGFYLVRNLKNSLP